MMFEIHYILEGLLYTVSLNCLPCQKKMAFIETTGRWSVMENGKPSVVLAIRRNEATWSGLNIKIYRYFGHQHFYLIQQQVKIDVGSYNEIAELQMGM